MSEKRILKKLDDIFNYCEEIDNHLPKEEQTGYEMLPDIFYIRKEVHNLQQKVEQQEKEIDRLNNIINELEEIINYEIQEWKDTDDELMKARVQEDKHILEVIEELKENNK